MSTQNTVASVTHLGHQCWSFLQFAARKQRVLQYVGTDWSPELPPAHFTCKQKG